MRVQDLVSGWMSERPVTIAHDRPLVEAYALMGEHNIRHLPVLRADGSVGMLSSHDLYRALPVVANTDISDLVETVKDLYTIQVGQIIPEQTLHTIDPMTTVSEAAELFLSLKVSSLPVVDGDQLVGILTSHDMMRALLQALKAKRS